MTADHHQWSRKGAGSPGVAGGRAFLGRSHAEDEAGRLAVLQPAMPPQPHEDGARRKRVLLIEDDRLLAHALEELLEEGGFSAFPTTRGAEAVELAETYRFDLALLDLTLPDMPGHDVLATLRALRPEMPVIILSGVTSLDAKLNGFEAGADDYVTKPFQTDELLARMHAVLRRTRAGAPTEAQVGPLTLDLVGHRATVDGKVVPLTGKEYACLEFLVARRGSTVTKEMFLAHLYGGRNEPEMKIIDVFICKLRRKLKDAGAPHVVETVWGRGYSVPA